MTDTSKYWRKSANKLYHVLKRKGTWPRGRAELAIEEAGLDNEGHGVTENRQLVKIISLSNVVDPPPLPSRLKVLNEQGYLCVIN